MVGLLPLQIPVICLIVFILEFPRMTMGWKSSVFETLFEHTTEENRIQNNTMQFFNSPFDETS